VFLPADPATLPGRLRAAGFADPEVEIDPGADRFRFGDGGHDLLLDAAHGLADLVAGRDLAGPAVGLAALGALHPDVDQAAHLDQGDQQPFGQMGMMQLLPWCQVRTA
jgi:hypothetical protein